MENKPTWYRGPGWYVNHIWWRGTPSDPKREMVMETIYICRADVTRDMAAMIANGSGYLGDTLQVIDLEVGNE
jgi:hypothetical protein